MSDTMDKGEGRGKGEWTERGRQAAQQDDIDALKALVQEMAGRLDALEGEQSEPRPGETPEMPPA